MRNKFLKLNDIKQLTKISGSKIYKLVEGDQFPKPIKIGKRSVRWLREEVNEWAKGKESKGQEVKEDVKEEKEQPKFNVEQIKWHNLTHDLEQMSIGGNYYVDGEGEREYPNVHVYTKNKQIRVKYKDVMVSSILGVNQEDPTDICDIPLFEVEVDGKKWDTRFSFSSSDGLEDFLTAVYTLVRAMKYEYQPIKISAEQRQIIKDSRL